MADGEVFNPRRRLDVVRPMQSPLAQSHTSHPTADAASIRAMLQPLQVTEVQRPENESRILRLQHAMLGNSAVANLPLASIPALTVQEKHALDAIVKSGEGKSRLDNIIAYIGQNNGQAKAAEYAVLAQSIIPPPAGRVIPITRETPAANNQGAESMHQQPWFQYLQDRISRISQMPKNILNADMKAELPLLTEAFSKLVQNNRLSPALIAAVLNYTSRERKATQDLITSLPQNASRDEQEAKYAAQLRLLTATEKFIITRAEKAV